MFRIEFLEGLTSDTLKNMIAYSESRTVLSKESTDLLRTVLKSRKEELK